MCVPSVEGCLIMVVIEVNYEYEGLGWDEVNSFCDKAKRDCLMDPDSVQVVVDERPDGSTAFLFSGKVLNYNIFFSFFFFSLNYLIDIYMLLVVFENKLLSWDDLLFQPSRPYIIMSCHVNRHPHGLECLCQMCVNGLML